MWGYVSDNWELVPGDGSSIWTSYSPEPPETWVCYLSLVFGNLSHQAELRGNRWDPLFLTETQLKYLGNLPWRGSRVLWCKRHTLPRGAAQKLCHSLESLLHFLKRNKKNHQLSPEHYQTQELVSTVSCQTQTAFWCIADADVAGRHRKHVHTRPYNIIWKVPENENFSSDQRKVGFLTKVQLLASLATLVGAICNLVFPILWHFHCAVLTIHVGHSRLSKTPS